MVILYFILFLFLFIIGQSFSMWGQYATLPFPKISMWEAYKMAIPFAWIAWIFITLAVSLANEYHVVSPTQQIFLLIVSQFCILLVINSIYLKQEIYKSDIIGFIILLFGFAVSYFHLVGKTQKWWSSFSENTEKQKQAKDNQQKQQINSKQLCNNMASS